MRCVLSTLSGISAVPREKARFMATLSGLERLFVNGERRFKGERPWHRRTCSSRFMARVNSESPQCASSAATTFARTSSVYTAHERFDADLIGSRNSRCGQGDACQPYYLAGGVAKCIINVVIVVVIFIRSFIQKAKLSP